MWFFFSWPIALLCCNFGRYLYRVKCLNSGLWMPALTKIHKPLRKDSGVFEMNWFLRRAIICLHRPWGQVELLNLTDRKLLRKYASNCESRKATRLATILALPTLTLPVYMQASVNSPADSRGPRYWILHPRIRKALHGLRYVAENGMSAMWWSFSETCYIFFYTAAGQVYALLFRCSWNIQS